MTPVLERLPFSRQANNSLPFPGCAFRLLNARLEYHVRVRYPAQRSIPATLAASFALSALLTVLTPWAAAQRSGHAAFHPATPTLNSPTNNHAFGQSAHRSGFRRSSPYTSLPFPFLGDFLNLDDLYSTGYPVASQPPVILVQTAPAMPDSSGYAAQPKNNREPPPAQPLMIELQNGRYTRLSSTAANGEPLLPEPNHVQPAKPARLNSSHIAASNSITQASALDLPPALLVFRDGHTEEVRDYAIADGFLYARGDYYADGYWNKKIAISTLNVRQTIEANAKHSIKFALPTSPNEVITRP